VTVWGRVPNGNGAPYNKYQGASFWGPASVHFGEAAFGTVWTLLRSFQTNTGVKIPCFPPIANSIFRGEELPTIMNQTEVTGFRVIITSNTQQTNETCNNPDGTVYQIQQQIATRWNDTRCIVDPPCILQFICDPSQAAQFATVTIIDNDNKCDYYNAYKAALGDVADRNCNCSTDSVTLSDDGMYTSTDSFCPSVAAPVDNHWWNYPVWVILVAVGCALVFGVIGGVFFIIRRKRLAYDAIQ